MKNNSGAQLSSTAGNGPSDALEMRLISQVRMGDANALEELYRRYSALVYSLCLRILGSHEAAEEVTIEVFYELWSRIDRYSRHRGRVTTYLLLLTRSRAIDRKRQRQRRMRLDGPGGDFQNNGQEPATTQPDPLEQLQLKERRTHVRSALRLLCPEYREALEMSFLDGLSHTEIARRLHMPVGTIKTRIRNGLIRLRAVLRR